MKRGILVTVLFIALIIFGFYLTYRVSPPPLADVECKGLIDSVKQSENHGTYYFLISGDWKYFGVYGDYVDYFADVGDSLVKQIGGEEIVIYRKDSIGNFVRHKSVKLSIYPRQSLE